MLIPLKIEIKMNKFIEVITKHKFSMIIISIFVLSIIMYIFYYIGYSNAIITAYNNVSADYENNFICIKKVKEVILSLNG